MKKIALIIISIIVCCSAIAQNFLSYKKVEVSLQSKSLHQLARLGIALDHALVQKDKVEVILSEDELLLVESNGFDFNIIMNDLAADLQNRNAETAVNRSNNFLTCDELFNDTITVPEQFNYGSMASFLTYDELLLELDSMAANYPNLITVKQAIDTFLTEEGRPIYFVKISDNPNVDESSSESQLLYDALHHAREPMSMTQLVFYMQYLLENYASNDEVKYIVDNLELYFIPCLNPDGYVYNETTNPNGGGFWRKNRRDNLDGTFGVDLNRNYGTDWGLDDIGSSPNTSSFTYRGPSAFSEPETKAIKYLCETHDFKASLNYHAYSNLLIFPTGYEPDSLRYLHFSEKITEHNHYTYGTGVQTLGYSVNGDSDAWMYHDVTNKLKQYSFTPEVGNNVDNFWPAANRIIPLCQENLLANINTALIIGNYVGVESTSGYSTDKMDVLSLDIQRFGLNDISNGTIKILPNNLLMSFDSEISLGSFTDMELKQVDFNYIIANGVNESTVIPIELELNLDNTIYSTTIYRIYTTQNPSYIEDFDGTLGGWTLGNWGTTNEDYVSADYSMTDSPNSNYSPNSTSELIFDPSIDLSSINNKSAYIKFNAKWETENGYDYVQLMVDDGSGYQPVCGNYTNIGVGFTGQPDGEPLYDGIQKEWIEEYVNLNDYLGSIINLKFVMKSDGAVEMDGFYLDDFYVYLVEEKQGAFYNQIEESHNSIVGVYPNPANNFIRIKTETTKNVNVSVINILGERVDVNYSFEGEFLTADVSNLKTGIYNISIIQNGEIIGQSNFVKE